MSVDIDGYNDVQSHDIRTARKAHKCDACRAAIKPGERYSYTFVVYDGDSSVTKRCMRCEAIFRHLCDVNTDSETGVDGELNCGHTYHDNDRGISGVSAPPCLEWFRALQARLRRVRVVCGDWTRVLGPSVLGKGKNVGGRRPCGVILDPPYDVNMRAKRIYNHDAPGLAAAVRDWAVEHGDDPDLRIVLCGYFDEHAAHMPPSWRVHRWKGARGYASEDNKNREEETLWFSPHCLSPEARQGSLFA